MANIVMDKFKEQMIRNLLESTNIKAVAVDQALYTFNSAHEFLSDIPVGARVATTANLTGKTFVNGLFDCDDFVWPTVSGASIEQVFLFIDTGTASTSRLIMRYDTATGLPVTPNGGNINVQVNAAGHFQV